MDITDTTPDRDAIRELDKRSFKILDLLDLHLDTMKLLTDRIEGLEERLDEPFAVDYDYLLSRLADERNTTDEN